MVVLHILNTDSFSGAENVVCQIVKMFRQNESYKMIYVSKDGPIREYLNKNNIDFRPIKKMTRNEILRVVHLTNPDIIHCHDFRASIVVSSLLLKQKIIFHLHSNPSWLKNKCINSYLFRIFSRKASMILGVSKSILDEYVFADSIKKKFLSVGNPVSYQRVIELSKQYEIIQDYDLVYCGRLSPEKRPDLFVNLAKVIIDKNKDIKCVVIGAGYLQNEISELIKSNELGKNFDLLGFVENPYPIIKKGKILLVTSEWEGFGLAAFEALALGLPVVCSNVGGLKGIVTNECGKLCDNTDDFITEIDLLINDSEYYLNKSIGAVQRAKAMSNEQGYYNTLLEIYER